VNLKFEGDGMRVGIFGGTFDPPHIGHLILAEECRDQMSLDRLLWILTPDPPHKQDQTISPAAIRLELVFAAIQDNPEFELSRVDINRPSPHYAVDTVRLLQTEFGSRQSAGQDDTEFFYVMGGDSLRDLPKWHDPRQFLAELSGVGVMRRPEDEVDLAALEVVLPGLTGKVQFVQAPLLEISSHQIRQRIACGKPYRYYLSPSVYKVIQTHDLYRTQP
jgi:nicotinate-nucleotide adenylyltransferase